ncbi:HU family DNA-binding protein [Erysipelothrix rhusiopathiae]|uniref:DNA-binding protein HU n=2 Tax=Erysipelothrix TaxID=1647 RepID=E7FV98_ERYRH|nr:MULTISPECIES: HU family DNA-binding protein [Erysipelothrix]CAH2762641.1 HU family DNA-binding protein [Erysipelothrix sp. A18Y020d]AGN24152.1 DNA-binding protein HU [Erysipelothrix rhusiopathiae SY1027]AMS11065.1 diphthine synthase [Erysipelothrix rhusiopathiae]AOO67563.1 diphthine synthase [Erysipelothrix rhusiopathiae]AWU41574.1 HU family DNA-binding protein [Erysipelothrix rhusiopathiae]
MSETYNKKLLSESIAGKLDISKKQANEFIETFLDEVKEILENKGTVDLAGFGKFEVRHRAERDGFNPQTKEKIRIAASHSVGFKPAKALKDAVK